ncbi:MAG TPA: YifB family Mg chelatase-like AAA ATPase [Burkholderiaceae bacterium]|jgi:magnesium chelatase family protein|nr:YifB family Mg chelatase-like AAA ATPase [Burkholderiaceae bacterium]
MTLAIVHSRALVGLQAPEVRVEVHLGNGLPAFHIVGLPQAAVRESADRVRAALLQGGFEFPNRRLTVNLAPADLPKDTGRFDLPIAVGVLAVSGQVPPDSLHELEFVGELSLTGEIRTVRGVLAMLLAIRAGAGPRRLVVPLACQAEAGLIDDSRSLAAANLAEVCAHLRGTEPMTRIEHQTPARSHPGHPDLGNVRGHQLPKRALEVAAAGGHSLLMVGPPGSGKTLLAGCLAGLLPPLSHDEAVDCARIASVAGRFDPAQWAARPLRAPHHSASVAALVGGGNPPRPGEITLAHQGVLFLDELPEFPRSALEGLREPLETGLVTLSRAARQATYPARFQLIAAMNPCPCGHHGSRLQACTCGPGVPARYRQRLSGPLLDRIDLQVDVTAIDSHELLRPALGAGSDDSAAVAARVAQARHRGLARQQTCNALLDSREIDRHCTADASARALLHSAARRFHWSARTVHRVLKVARTLADLAGREVLAEADIAEAVHYRRSAILAMNDGNTSPAHLDGA